MSVTSSFRSDLPTEELTGYTPTEEELRSVAEWFERYDSLSARSDVRRTAELAAFPLNLVTDHPTGGARHGQWDREHYLATMAEVMEDAEGTGEAGESHGTDGVAAETRDGGIGFASVRTPFFLSGSLVVVFSRSTVTAGGTTRQLHYADILLRTADGWRFQTMVQPGWGDMLERNSAS